MFWGFRVLGCFRGLGLLGSGCSIRSRALGFRVCRV